MTDATEQHDEWCAKNGCRCGKCPCGEFDDCHPMTDATELDEAMRARVSEYLATWEPYRGGQSLSTHGGKHLFLKDVRALLAALDEIERLRAALVASNARANDWMGAAAAREDALRAAESALAAVRALADSEDAQAVLFGVTGTHPETYGGVTKDEALECAGEVLTRIRGALATLTTTEETR